MKLIILGKSWLINSTRLFGLNFLFNVEINDLLAAIDIHVIHLLGFGMFLLLKTLKLGISNCTSANTVCLVCRMGCKFSPKIFSNSLKKFFISLYVFEKFMAL